MSIERDLAKRILEILDDPYKPPEGKTQLIRESCTFVLEIDNDKTK
jgi:hypothetical protein